MLTVVSCLSRQVEPCLCPAGGPWNEAGAVGGVRHREVLCSCAALQAHALSEKYPASFQKCWLKP